MLRRYINTLLKEEDMRREDYVERRLRSIANKHAFDIDEEMKNGGKLALITIEQILRMQLVFQKHEEREGRLLRGIVMLIMGMSLCSWSSTWPPLRYYVEGMLHVQLPEMPEALIAVIIGMGGFLIVGGLSIILRVETLFHMFPILDRRLNSDE